MSNLDIWISRQGYISRVEFVMRRVEHRDPTSNNRLLELVLTDMTSEESTYHTCFTMNACELSLIKLCKASK